MGQNDIYSLEVRSYYCKANNKAGRRSKKMLQNIQKFAILIIERMFVNKRTEAMK